MRPQPIQTFFAFGDAEEYRAHVEEVHRAYQDVEPHAVPEKARETEIE